MFSTRINPREPRHSYARYGGLRRKGWIGISWSRFTAAGIQLRIHSDSYILDSWHAAQLVSDSSMPRAHSSIVLPGRVVLVADSPIIANGLQGQV